jgi:hypothetical protein
VADAARVLRPGLKVLFITGYAENAVLSDGHLDPGMQVVTKPFAIEDLAAQDQSHPVGEVTSAGLPQISLLRVQRITTAGYFSHNARWVMAHSGSG